MKNERLPGFNAESSLHKIDENYLSYYYRVREQSTITQQARTGCMAVKSPYSACVMLSG
jgi:hypothetical protein